MIRDTNHDLKEHLERLDERVQSLAAGVQDTTSVDSNEILAMWEEKKSTQQGLIMCSQLAAQIESLESTSKEHPSFSQQPSAHKYIKTGLGATKGSLNDLVSRLQNHENDILKRMTSMGLTSELSVDEATQLAQLQETKESIRQCMNVVANAGESLTLERTNIFEDITMSDNSYGISVSTVKDLVVARRVNLKGQARYVGGQISDESYQKTIEALTQLDQDTVRYVGKDVDKTPTASEGEARVTAAKEFVDRFGRGFKLPQDIGASASEGTL